MRHYTLVALSIASVLALAACGAQSGPPSAGLGSSAPDAVSSAAGGIAGGGNNAFTRQQVTPGTPAGQNMGLQSPQP